MPVVPNRLAKRNREIIALIDAGSGDFVDETYARVLNGTNKGVIVDTGIGGPDYGAWVGSGQVCVQANWSPTCRALPPVPPI